MEFLSSDDVCEIAEEYAALMVNLIRGKRAAGWSDAAIYAEVERLPGLLRAQLTDRYGEAEFIEQVVRRFTAVVHQHIE